MVQKATIYHFNGKIFVWVEKMAPLSGERPVGFELINISRHLHADTSRKGLCVPKSQDIR